MLPVLYSFRRCPYAIRARLALKYSGITVALREVILSDKPDDMLTVSPKATVPVLVLPDETVIDESRDIIVWALSINDPDSWLPAGNDYEETIKLIKYNDKVFKEHLDHYKYAVRFPEHSPIYYRNLAEEFLQKLDSLIDESGYLFGDFITMADIAIFPFIRQFAFVDKEWFDQSPYPNLQTWLNNMLGMELFTNVMSKYQKWAPGNEIVKF